MKTIAVLLLSIFSLIIIEFPILINVINENIGTLYISQIHTIFSTWFNIWMYIIIFIWQACLMSILMDFWDKIINK